MKQAVARDVGLDRLRGLAVVLMVVDHVAKTLPDNPEWLTLTVTRLSLPLFMVTLGVLLAGRSHPIQPERFLQLGVAGVVTSFVFSALGRGTPDVLLVIALTVPLWDSCKRWPEVVACLGVVQFAALPIPWTGYQPGLLVTLICLGVLASRERWSALGDRLPSWVAGVGRWPLTIYVVHVLALPGLHVVVR